MLTFEPKHMATICRVLERKLLKPLEKSGAAGLGRSRTVISHSTTSVASITRSVSMLARQNPSSANSMGSADKDNLVTLKALTVLVYLCQWGSGAFMNWLRSRYLDIVVPLATLGYPSKIAPAIYAKVSSLITYCEDDSALETSRDSVDQIRAELNPRPRVSKDFQPRLSSLSSSIPSLVYASSSSS